MFGFYRYQGPSIPGTTVSGTLYDQHVPTSPSTASLGIPPNGQLGYSQSWTSRASPTEVAGVVLRLKRDGTVRGLVRVAIHAHSGTYGTSSVPTGSALVFSPWYAVDEVSTSITDYWFPLSGWTPDASTRYTIVVEQDIPFSYVTGSQRLTTYTGANAEATHSGNRATLLNSGWGATSNLDLLFKIYDAGSGAVASGLPELIRLSGTVNVIVQTTPANPPTRQYN